MPIEPLSLEQCVLLKKYEPTEGAEVVRLYEDCRAVLGAIELHAPHVLAKSDLAAVLKKAREKLVQPRYQVGLLGFFQSGKSTTLNRLLGFRNDDPRAPAKEGGTGRATTAVPTRVRAGTAAEGDLAWLEYLRQSEIDRLLKALRADLQFADSEKESRLIALIRQDPDFKNQGSKRQQPLQYLFWLLNSLEWGRSRLSDNEGQRKKDPCKYGDRFKLANHPVDQDFSSAGEDTLKTPLLESVCLQLTLEGFPTELEIIDLPGLGSVNVKDNFITQSFVAEKDSKVDGALIFCEPGRLELQEVVSFAQDLREEWKDLDGRAWMCFCRMDEVAENRLVSRNGEPSVLQNMLHFMRKYGFPDDQAVFISNYAHKLGEAARSPTEGLAELNCPAFSEAWRDLHLDGGVGYLRKIVFERMPREVARGIAREWKVKLTALARDLASRGRCAFGAVKEPRSLQRGNVALTRLTNGINELQAGREFMASNREILKEELAAALKELELNPAALDAVGGLAKQYPQHALVLQSRLQRHVFEMLDTAFRSQSALLESAENGEPLVGISSAPEGLARVWDEFRTQDRRLFSRNSDGSVLPSFLTNGPFEGFRPDDQAIPGEAYVSLLTEKVSIVSRQVVQAMQERIVAHLWALVAGIKSFLEVDLSKQNTTQSEEFKKQVDEFHRRYGADEKDDRS